MNEIMTCVRHEVESFDLFSNPENKIKVTNFLIVVYTIEH